MASKRQHISTGDTPGKPREKLPNQCHGLTSRSLFSSSTGTEINKNAKWSAEETSALVQYICLYWEGASTDKWPKFKNIKFWNHCSEAVNKIRYLYTCVSQFS